MQCEYPTCAPATGYSRGCRCTRCKAGGRAYAAKRDKKAPRKAPRKVAEYTRKTRLKCTYGITPEQYERMFRNQQGRCAICERPPKNVRLAVDHDHATGFVRGLLCTACNRALAAFHDKPGLLDRAAAYLRENDAEYDSLDAEDQENWLLYRGRTSGKLRRQRISKNGYPQPRLPKSEDDCDDPLS